MTEDDERRRTTTSFACQVLGLNGTSEQEPPPDSPLGRLRAAQRAGASQEEVTSIIREAQRGAG